MNPYWTSWNQIENLKYDFENKTEPRFYRFRRFSTKTFNNIKNKAEKIVTDEDLNQLYNHQKANEICEFFSPSTSSKTKWSVIHDSFSCMSTFLTSSISWKWDKKWSVSDSWLNQSYTFFELYMYVAFVGSMNLCFFDFWSLLGPCMPVTLMTFYAQFAKGKGM